MAAANFSREDFEIIYGQFEGNPDFVIPNAYRRAPEKKNRCAWLKMGSYECCGKKCVDAYCAKHTEMAKRGCRVPLPCSVCLVGVKNFEFICKKCRLEKEKRQLGHILARQLENNEEWHIETSSENASGFIEEMRRLL